MRSKILKLIAVLAICFLIGAALVSCGNKDGKGEAGANGATGATGNGIATIRLSDDGLKYIVTYTNGTTEEVDVPAAPCPNNCENVTTFEYVSHKRVYNAETEAYDFVEGKYLDVCNDCGRSQIVTEVRHSMTSSGIVAPTCTEEGFEGAICTVCAHEERVEGTEIPALEHSTEVYTPVLENDKNICEEGGYIICVCDNLNREGEPCGEVFTKKVEPLGHKIETWNKENDPTALATGTLTGVCVNCTETITLDLNKLNDEDYAYAVTTAPTCTVDGTGTFTYTVPAELVLEDGLVKENVTVTTVGEHKFAYNATVLATGHFINGVSLSTYEKVGTAYVYGQPGINALDGQNPKCGETGEGFYECSACKVPYLVAIVGPHIGEVTETAPTCTEGNKFTCDECNQTWLGEEDALGHDLVPTLLANEAFTTFTFVYDCSRCNHTEGSQDVTTLVGDPEILEFCNKNGSATYKYEYETGKFATVVKTLPSNLDKHTLKVDDKTVLPEEDGYYSYNKYAAFITVLNNTDMKPCGATGEGVATCGECGVPFGVEIKTYHEYELDTEDSRYVAATCTQLGTDVFVCTRTGCDESYTAPSAELAPHNYVYDAYQIPGDDKWYISAKCACGATEDGVHGVEGQVSSEITTDPTCTAKGVETITITAVIGGQNKTFTRTKPVEELKHKLGGVDITTLWNATEGAYNYNANFVVLNTAEIVCESGSLYAGYYQCDECAIKYSVQLYITHLWDEGTVTKEPTCTVNGETTYKCTICTTGTKVEANIPATGHGAEYLTAKVTTAPTQFNTGILTVHCSDCGADLTFDLPALNSDSYTKTELSKADCYNQGKNKYTINNFETSVGKFYVEVEEITDKTAHSVYVPGVTATETFTEQEMRLVGGQEVLCNVTYTVYKCENCGTYIKVGTEVVVPVEDTNA